jgi:hypothetical protein
VLITGLTTNNNTVRRVIAWDANPATNDMPFAVNYGSHNVLEDVAAWGSGRKSISHFSDSNTVIRRAFMRWSHSTNTAIKTALTLSYNSTDALMENLIGTWDAQSDTDPSQWAKIIGVDGPQQKNGVTNKFYGSIVYTRVGQKTRDPGDLSWLYTLSGTCDTAHGINNTLLWNDLLALREARNNTTNDSEMHWGCNQVGTNYTRSTGSLSGGTHTTEAGAKTLGQFAGGLMQLGSQTRPASGAWLKYRYVNGQLTTVPLWPWPMNERIKAAMVQSGYHQRGGISGVNCTAPHYRECDLTSFMLGLTGDHLGAPTITQQPISQTVVLDCETVTYSVGATGTPPLSYQWQRDGTDIPGATGSTYSPCVGVPEAGSTYRAVVTSPAGQVTSQPARLTVQ